MGQTGSKPTAQGQVESSINDTINFIMAKVAAGEIDAATATELIAAARKDYESNVPVTASAQQAVQPQQSANTYQANPQTAYAVPEMEPEQTPVDYGQFATPTNYPHTYDVEDSSDVDMDALSGIAGDMLDKQPRKKLSRKERKAKAKEMKKLQKETNAKLKANAKSNKSIQKQLKERDKELSKKNEFARYKRKTAKDVTSFIGYNRMYEDGICEVEEGMFSSCICFEDTSYHSVREDAQKAVFTSICRLYDQFGADTLVQFNIINTPLLKEQIGHRKFFNPSSQLNVNAANDAAVFNEILNEKMRQGVSNIRRKMYITFSVSAATVDDAVPKLTRIENQISQILTSIGSKSRVLDGAERLALLNSQLNPLKPFNFDYRRDISARMVQTTKDCIAPTTLDFKPEGLADCFKTGDMWGQVLVIKKLGSELTDQALSDITELPIPLNVTWFAQPMDKAAAVAFTRQRLAWIDKEIIEEQRSAVQKGYDFSILPQELKYSKEETEDVIDNLQNKNQRLYVFTGLFYTYAPTKKQLDNQVLSIISSGAYGICQWLGGRKTGLENLAKQKGKDMSDLSVQLDWFWDEFAESCSGWNKAKYKVFCAQSDLKQCVYLFRSQFERCGESEAADANRLAQAQRIYDALGTSNGTNGIDGNGQDLKKATRRQKDVVNAANTTTSPGQGWCAAWVTNVFQNAGIGYFGGNACDMCRAYCTSTNVRDLKVGMIIADVSHPGTGDAGRLYGHVGIYIGDNNVISNEGPITIKSLQEFVGFYGKGTGCKWGWLGGVDLSK